MKGEARREVVARVRKIVVSLIALAAAVSVLGGCSLAQTTPDQVALRYSGSDVFAEAEVFKKCYTPSESEHGSPGDKVYTYPAGQRTFKFSADPGSDAPPMLITAKGGVQMTVSGTVSFTPQFQNCDTLRDFHERIGRKFNAPLESFDDTTGEQAGGLDGWNRMLGVYVKDPTDRAVDNVSLNYEWNLLASDAATKQTWEQQTRPEIERVMKEQSGGEFFRIDSVVLQAPQMPAQLQDGLQAEIRAQQQARAAEIAQSAANACDASCLAYQQAQALNKAIESGNVPVIPVPQGSPIQVGVPAPAPR